MSKDHPRWTEVKTALLCHVPFFSSLLFDLMEVHIGKFPEKFPPGIAPTAATDGKNIWVDEAFLNALKVPEAVFLFCHEIGHAIWMHLTRGKYYQDNGIGGEKFDPLAWNCAGDYLINDMLTKSNIGKMPAGGLLDRKYSIDDHTTEYVYADIIKTKSHQRGNGPMDVHILSGSAVPDIEMKRAVQTAADHAKAQGKLPKSLERFANEFVQPKVSWKERLRYHVARSISRDATTWSKPHRRRLLTQGVYLAAYTGFGAGDVVVVIDTSGSIGPAELNVFCTELDQILSDCNPTSVVLLGCDAQVNSELILQAGDSLAANPPKLGGGGGTDFRPPFEWVVKQGSRPSALIYFTDMYGPFPEQPGYPVIWCKTTEQPAPWGEEIYVDLKQ
jgi:predicted metal-dependent peptidase